jgi:hypothetical protein
VFLGEESSSGFTKHLQPMSDSRAKLPGLRVLALPSEGLELFRRGLGLLCILDACFRLPDFTFWLSDLGVLPRSLYFRLYEESLAWSIYSISGRPEYVLFLLVATIGLGLLQLVARTRSARWTRVCLWLLVLSVQNRNPALVDSSDDLLRLMLFWDIFLPDGPQDQDVVTPGTLGLQLQLSLAFFVLNWYTTPQSWSQAAAWSLRDYAFVFSWLWIPVKISLILLLAALWLRPFRIVALGCSLPVLALWGVFLHPFLPLTLGVAALVLFGTKSYGLRPKSARPAVVVLTLLVSLLAVGQFVPAVRAPSKTLAEAFGLQQMWSRSYPLSTENVVELVARDSQAGQVVWFLDNRSGRRARLWADEVAKNLAWTSRLEDALKYQVAVQHGPAIWMKQTGVKSNQALGLTEIQLLTETPVQGPVHGRSLR